MDSHKIKIGFIGLTPGQSWASFAHLPALAELKEQFSITAVANSNYESSLRAAQAAQIPNAFANADTLVNSNEVDIVAVTVRVPVHKEVVTKAIMAGKAIYCEWPLARNLDEAKELAKLAKEKNVRTFIGTQALGSPAIRHLKTLIQEGSIGKVLSQTISGYGSMGGPEISDEAENLYLLDRNNGATMLTIPVAHTLSAVQYVFGKFNKLSSVVTTKRKQVLSREKNKLINMTSPDQVAIQAVLEDESIFSLHYRGGLAPDGRGLTWEINGMHGAIRITGRTGLIQIEDLKIEICLEHESEFRKVEIPTDSLNLCPGQFIPGNVARMYEVVAADLKNGTSNAPGFEYAVELHQLIEKIEKSSILKGEMK